MTQHPFLIALACLSIACGGTAPTAADPDDHAAHEGEEERADHEEGQGEEAHAELSAEAIERAGIVVGVAERRALTGGVAIPAEVEFDPTGTAHVGPLLPGRFTGLKVGIGDSVRRNQLLGTIASSDASASRSLLQQARARLKAAETTLQRQQQLTDEGIGAQRALIEAEAEVAELRAQVEGLRSQLSVYGSGRGGEMRLVSPIDGVVVDVHATLGENASPDQVAFTVTDPRKIWVRGNVPELTIERVETGAAVVVRIHAFPDFVLRGTITYVAPALDPETRSLPIRVSLENPDARLRSGLFGSIELIGGGRDDRVVAIPADAIASLDGRYAVFVPGDEPNSFEPRFVRLGRRGGAFFEVVSGLDEGTKIVTHGAFTLKSVLKSSELSEGHAH